MAPVLKRLTISLTGSTSLMAMGLRFRNPNRPRSVSSEELCSSTARVYSLNVS